jgi:hypothetical protein
MYHAHNVRFQVSDFDDHIHNDKNEFFELTWTKSKWFSSFRDCKS